MDAGMVPLNLLETSCRTERFARFPIYGGSSPEKWLVERPKFRKFRKFPISRGMEPENAFISRNKYLRFVSRPISEGSSPVKLLF
ncbi:hypothetical protein CDL12_03846 [Handroanthus impetiginosus]|uniref:Uncharacterized protein n=1 Tax=Handroanthus impetiginosus TaxID=429701 RepID=A0A2G9I0X7_9LAMI|nr:hypothetical protein CDL12_03846 [Handroanthus impetiginosus]